jgi:hypothetical protein
VLFLPYWLLAYEDMTTMLIDRSDQNAPNQAMVLSRTVTAGKRSFLEAGKHKEVLANFTIDSPVPYDMQEVLKELRRLDAEMVPSTRGEKQGEFHGRLGRFIARLENKLTDRRLGFMMAAPAEAHQFGWLGKLSKSLMAGTRDQADKKGGGEGHRFLRSPIGHSPSHRQPDCQSDLLGAAVDSEIPKASYRAILRRGASLHAEQERGRNRR